jgi:hypothetical protein
MILISIMQFIEAKQHNENERREPVIGRIIHQ